MVQVCDFLWQLRTERFLKIYWSYEKNRDKYASRLADSGQLAWFEVLWYVAYYLIFWYQYCNTDWKRIVVLIH